MTANALKEAIKIVKGQFRIEANKKKICKSLVFELIMQEIVEDHIKNKKRILIKVRELITSFGKKDAKTILDNCEWARDNEDVDKIFEENIAEDEVT